MIILFVITEIGCKQNNYEISNTKNKEPKINGKHTLHEYVKILFEMEHHVNVLEKEYEETTSPEDKHKNFMNSEFVLYMYLFLHFIYAFKYHVITLFIFIHSL